MKLPSSKTNVMLNLAFMFCINLSRISVIPPQSSKNKASFLLAVANGKHFETKLLPGGKVNMAYIGTYFRK